MHQWQVACRALEAQLLIAEQNATNYQAKLQELGLGAAELDAMAKPTSGESLILSGDEDNYLTSLVVKVCCSPVYSGFTRHEVTVQIARVCC